MKSWIIALSISFVLTLTIINTRAYAVSLDDFDGVEESLTDISLNRLNRQKNRPPKPEKLPPVTILPENKISPDKIEQILDQWAELFQARRKAQATKNPFKIDAAEENIKKYLKDAQNQLAGAKLTVKATVSDFAYNQVLFNSYEHDIFPVYPENNGEDEFPSFGVVLRSGALETFRSEENLDAAMTVLGIGWHPQPYGALDIMRNIPISVAEELEAGDKIDIHVSIYGIQEVNDILVLILCYPYYGEKPRYQYR